MNKIEKYICGIMLMLLASCSYDEHINTYKDRKSVV